MSTEMLTKEELPVSQTIPSVAVARENDELRAAARRQVKRVRRLKINLAAWVSGTTLLTTLWVVNEWQANGALQSFGHEGNPGQWNPTLWALAVGLWSLVVGIMALRVYLRRPATAAELDRELQRLKPQGTGKGVPSDGELRLFTRAHLEGLRRLRFHVAAWALGMIVLTPLWALIEWQDNGAFDRFSDNSQPGDWEPWILYVGGIWALVIAVLALKVFFDRPTTEAEIDRELERLRSRG